MLSLPVRVPVNPKGSAHHPHLPGRWFVWSAMKKQLVLVLLVLLAMKEQLVLVVLVLLAMALLLDSRPGTGTLSASWPQPSP